MLIEETPLLTRSVLNTGGKQMGNGGSSIDALQELTQEHEAVLSNLVALQQVLEGMQRGLAWVDSAALDTAENVVRALETDLAVHLRKEEEVLFPSLEAYLGREQGPIGVMLMEHEDLRRIVPMLADALAVLKTGADSVSRQDALQEVLRWGHGLIGLLRQHIAKEDQCLFPMAASHMGRSRLLVLGEEMRGIARDAGGHGE